MRPGARWKHRSHGGRDVYLKRIELQGFKTFVGRTAFEFGSGITAVVGPNGSGKSNVADALRWVLGEQSGRALRARKTEDVIFAGSARRAAMGMAEVTITLDNADGWLPVDFSEVLVGRRIYRSGESEYFINNAKVRLRDVLDLFRRANVGQNSYAFMGQGMVDAVLSLRPEERRGLIEEAAEVKRHQVRLEEAQGRLKATLENLERVTLLIAEIAPRLNQLERQAQRASEYERLSRELAVALRTLFTLRWEQGQESMAAARARHDQCVEGFQAATRQLQRAEAGLSAVRERLGSARKQLSEREAERARLSYELTRLEQSIALDRERHSMVSSRREELQLEIESLDRERLALSESTIDEGRRELTLDQELEAARSTLAAENESLNRLEAELAASREAVVTTEERAIRARSGAADARARIGRIDGQIARLQREQVEIERRIRDQGAALTAAAARLRELKDREDVLAREFVAAEREQRMLQANGGEALDQVQALKDQVASLERKRETLAARLELLQRFQAEQKGAESGVRAIFEAAEGSARMKEAGYNPETPPIRGVLGLISRLIRVPAGLERAIETALAEHLQAIVIEHAEDAVEALRRLVSQQAGRAFLLPKDAIKHAYPVNLNKERGVIGVASALVRYDGAHRALVETLLGRTVVVQDIEAAQLILRRGLGNAVTLDGILFRQNGTLYGGASDGEGNVFEREQDLLSIPEEISDLDAQLVELRAALETALNRHEQTQTVVARASAHVESLRLRHQELRAAMDDQRLQLGPLRGELRWASSASRRIVEEGNERREEQERLREEAETFDAAALDMGTDAAERRQALTVFDEHRAALMGRVGEASAIVARHEGERRTIAVLRERQEAAIARIENQASNKRVQARNLELEASVLSGRVESAQRELGEFSQRLSVVNDALGPQGRAVAVLEEEEQAAMKLLTEAQGALLESERRVLEAEAEVRFHSEGLDAVQRSMASEGYAVSDAGEVVTRGELFTDLPEWLADEKVEGNVPPIAGGADVDADTLEKRIATLRDRTRTLGPINAEAPADYRENKERHDFLTEQVADLRQAEASLREAIAELQELIREQFGKTFEQVNVAFAENFVQFFGGGSASLQLAEEDAGVEIIAQPPGKRVQALAMLSGGERALTAISLLFALLSVNPSPFCVMDEVDAALDEANVGRFAAALRGLADRTQFIVVTHNRRTIEQADSIYGISMGDNGASRVLSLRMADLPAD